MAEPTEESASEVSLAPVNCPHCGAPVTEEAAEAGDKGRLFKCPTCGTIFGIVPGISEAEQGLATP